MDITIHAVQRNHFFKIFEALLQTILEKRVFMTNHMQSFIHDPHSTSSNKETFLQDFLVILKRSSELLNNLEEMFPR